MQNPEQNWQEFTEDIVEELLEDGSNAEAMHIIEHHFSGDDFDQLESAAVAIFKQGFEVEEPEEFETEDGERILGFDVVIESPLEVEPILEDIAAMEKFAAEFNLSYDGWGTYFEE